MLREHSYPHAVVDLVGTDDRSLRSADGARQLFVDLAESGTPVHDRRKPGLAEINQERHPVHREVNERVEVGSGPGRTGHSAQLAR